MNNNYVCNKNGLITIIMQKEHRLTLVSFSLAAEATQEACTVHILEGLLLAPYCKTEYAGEALVDSGVVEEYLGNSGEAATLIEDEDTYFHIERVPSFRVYI